MSENIEFISAKDLPITEAEEVDVICVENGEMKRKPAKGLGGNGAYDFEMTFKTSFSADEDNMVCEHTVIHQEDFAVVKEKILSGEEVRAKFRISSQTLGADETTPYATENITGSICCSYFPEGFADEAPELIFVEQFGTNMRVSFVLLPDNSLMDVYGGFD